MRILQIFDPAMCCSTGVCGPSIDKNLVRLASDVAFLKSQGIQVTRFNLGLQPEAFIANTMIIAEMGEEAELLPIYLVDGEIKAKGSYPHRNELASWFGLQSEIAPAKPLMSLKMATSSCCDSETEGCC